MPINPNELPDDLEDSQGVQTYNMAGDESALQVPGTNELRIVSLYLPGKSDPVVLTGAKSITLGRRDPQKELNPTVDLTEYNGAKLGVSRLHAEIIFENGKYFVVDKSSANGTWINENRLQADRPTRIESGDQLRLGQLAIGVHIAVPHSSDVDDVISTYISDEPSRNSHIYRISSGDGASLLTEQKSISYSALRFITTYLNTIEAITNITREAQQMPSEGVNLFMLRASITDDRILVEIGGATDILNFMGEKLNTIIAVIDGQKKGTKKQTNSLERYKDPMQQIADYALQEIVFRFLHDTRDNYVKQLAPHFETIVNTNLHISIVQ